MSKTIKSDTFQLVKALDKGEKRNFKLFMGRVAASKDLKVVTLFDAMDRMETYDERVLLQRHPELKKHQLSNLKAHLYRQVLASLRMMRNEQAIDMQLHEQLDQARILYNKGLYRQSLKVLEKAKQRSREYNQITFWMQALFLEKKIETLHITRSFDDRAEVLAEEVVELNDRLTKVGQLSNLALQLYGWYIKNGHVRDERDVLAVKAFYQAHLPERAIEAEGFYERLYLYQSQAWYGFILQDFLVYYRNCQRWVDLFEREPQMIRAEPQHFIKGMHNILNAHFLLRNDKKFLHEKNRFEAFSNSAEGKATINSRVQCFVYLYLAKLNRHFLAGSFSEGLTLVPVIEEGLKKFALHIDRHRTLVFYYKIACLFFGCGDYNQAITYLNKIIHWNADLRSDLQCYARMLHLIAHFELGNNSIIEHQLKSLYRFMSKMENLSTVELRIFDFLRNAIGMSRARARSAFQQLHEQLKELEGRPTESRSFMYLDIVSWLESKIRKVPVQTVIADRYRSRSHAA
ncbi:MAG: hypothetical protein FJX83_03565 [Bacteroidetes bacterium]|nr:hypothetical protein [Bacteroidota bacterium]